MAEMTTTMRSMKLIDQSRSMLAIVQVVDEGDYYGGIIDLYCTPPDLRDLFDEFEEMVNGQMFSFADEIENKIESRSIKAVFENGEEVSIRDLQVYPSTGNVSFKLAPFAAHAESAIPCETPNTM